MAQRLDKWLVYARFVKHRSAASRMIEDGQVRVNRERMVKISHVVKEQDVLTIALAGHVRVVRILGSAERRGSPSTTMQLYEELTPAILHPSPSNLSEAEKSGARVGSVC